MKEDDLKMPQMEAPPGNSSETLDKDKSRRMKVSGAINKIMSSDTTGIAILDKRKEIIQSYEDHKVEERARKVLAVQKRKRIELIKKSPDEYDLAEEKAFKRITTLGVVRLLNAIKAERRALRVSEMVDVAGEERTSQAHAEKLKSQFLESLSREAS